MRLEIFSSIFLRSDEKTPIFFALLPSRFIIYGSALDLLVVCLFRIEQGRDRKKWEDVKSSQKHHKSFMDNNGGNRKENIILMHKLLTSKESC